MPPFRWAPAAVLYFLGLPVTAAPASEPPDPLFLSHDILEVRLVAPFTAIMKERGADEEFGGRLRYVDAAGEPVEIDVGIRTRGELRMRKRVCRFAPLRLNFKKKQTKDSLFHHQDKVKLVTHCVNGSKRYEQSLLREYIAYRILNELTDVSFSVRLFRITYVDTSGRGADRETFAFVIEDRDRLAKRLELDAVDLAMTRPRSLKPDYMNVVSLFHYLIGNTDFSPIKGSEGSCCHNHQLIGSADDLLYSVPYDFDQAGLVNAPYASPNPRFKLRSVRQRLYRGYCINNDHLDSTIALYQQRRLAILGLIRDQFGLDKRARRYMKDYIDAFYETISSPEHVQNRLIKKCI